VKRRRTRKADLGVRLATIFRLTRRSLYFVHGTGILKYFQCQSRARPRLSTFHYTNTVRRTIVTTCYDDESHSNVVDFRGVQTSRSPPSSRVRYTRVVAGNVSIMNSSSLLNDPSEILHAVTTISSTSTTTTTTTIGYTRTRVIT